jgi:hypothetical protein
MIGFGLKFEFVYISCLYVKSKTPSKSEKKLTRKPSIFLRLKVVLESNIL